MKTNQENADTLLDGMQDPYKSLNVPKDADETSIKRAYFRLVRQHPPDKDPQGFERIRRAYDVLSDPKRRAEYDALHQYGDEIEALLDEANQHIEKEEWKKAARLLKEILILHPGAKAARHLLILCQIRLEAFQDAKKTLAPLFLDEDGLDDAHFLEGQIAYKRGYLAKTNHPQLAQSLFLEALQCYRKSHEIKPIHPGYILHIAHCYYQLDDNPNAILWLERYLSDAQRLERFDDIYLYIRLIELYTFEKQNESAKQTAHRLLKHATTLEDAINQQKEEHEEKASLLPFLANELGRLSLLFFEAEAFEHSAYILDNAALFDDKERFQRLSAQCRSFHAVKSEFSRWLHDQRIEEPLRRYLAFLFIFQISTEKDPLAEQNEQPLLQALNQITLLDFQRSLNHLQNHYPKTAKHFQEILQGFQDAIHRLNEKYNTPTHPTTYTTTHTNKPHQQTSLPQTKPSTPTTPQQNKGCGSMIATVFFCALAGTIFGPVGTIIGFIVGIAIASED